MKIAVIGSGISGLGTALLLSQKHEVHLFEASNRLGGHAHTSSVTVDNGKQIFIDTGFLVYNDLTYPHLRSLFKFLRTETVASDMSLSIQVPQAGLEWAGNNLDSVFAQRKNIFNPRFHKLLFAILDFHKKAEKLRDLSSVNRWTIGDLLREQNYPKELMEWYILPMVAAIWSTPEKGMLDFPAETFLTFFINHKLLQVNDRPVWRTVKNGSKNYVDQIAAKLEHIHLNEAVNSVENVNGVLQLKTHLGDYQFDRVVFATHAPVTAKIYKFKHARQEKLIKSFATIPNQAILHSDLGFMPQREKCWASWNVQAQLGTAASDKVSLTYLLNRLQPIDTDRKMLLTLNPSRKPSGVMLSANYEHPKFDQLAIDAQNDIPHLQGIDGVYFAGAWTRYGFHEDGLLSAVNVAKLFEIETPWRVE
ncbi:NAD/FAD-binding protein [Bdellovibrio sp. qaytius]|nr:NAD/FAD-binding protein [Bdellovibrio sp. qaytius]